MNLGSDLKKFIFFGEDVFSLVVLESLVNSELNLSPLAVVMLESPSVSGRRLADYCLNQGIKLIRTHSVCSDEFIARFENVEYDLIIAAHFQRLLPPVLFCNAKIGAMNLHPSLLPKYRGMSPQHWPIILGDDETGVTVHYIDQGVDTGRILRQVSIPLESDIYIHQLQKKFLTVYKTIMVEAVELAIRGRAGDEQQVDGGTYFHKIQDEDMKITQDMAVERAYGLVRAFSYPYNGARFDQLRITKAKPVEEVLWMELHGTDVQSGLQQIGDAFYLVLKDGALELLKWKST